MSTKVYLKKQLGKRVNELTWTMRDGTEILLKDMSTSHILNTIKFLKRSLDYHEDLEDQGWGFLCSLNGDMAQMAMEGELNKIGKQIGGLHDWIGILQLEIEYRSNDISSEDSRWPLLLKRLSKMSI